MQLYNVCLIFTTTVFRKTQVGFFFAHSNIKNRIRGGGFIIQIEKKFTLFDIKFFLFGCSNVRLIINKGQC